MNYKKRESKQNHNKTINVLNNIMSFIKVLQFLPKILQKIKQKPQITFNINKEISQKQIRSTDIQKMKSLIGEKGIQELIERLLKKRGKL